MVAEIYRSSDYGSEGWGFESLRARNIKGRPTCGNVGRTPFKICPLWTPGAPRVLVCFGAVRAGVRGSVLLRADESGSWPVWSWRGPRRPAWGTVGWTADRDTERSDLRGLWAITYFPRAAIT